ARGETFLKAVPMRWLAVAARLPGQCLAVGILLWFWEGRRKSRTFTFCLARGEAFGVSAQAARRALRRLEANGLVTLIRKSGRGLEVTILDAPTGITVRQDP